MAEGNGSSILTRRFRAFVRRSWEKLVGQFYEGPEPPDRIADMVVFFANSNPHATRLDWVTFCTEHAREVYKSGYVRGMENAERDPDDPPVDPDVIADAIDPNWRWIDGGIILTNPEKVVPEFYDEDENAREQVDQDFGGGGLVR